MKKRDGLYQLWNDTFGNGLLRGPLPKAARMALRRAVSQLPERERLVIQEYYYAGKKYKDIALIFPRKDGGVSVSPTIIGVRLHKALRRLRHPTLSDTLLASIGPAHSSSEWAALLREQITLIAQEIEQTDESTMTAAQVANIVQKELSKS